MTATLKKLLTSRAAKIIGSVLLVLILISALSFYWAQNRSVNQTEASNFTSQIQQLQKDNKHQDAINETQTFLDHKKMSTQVRAQITFLQASNYLIINNPTKALELFQKAAALKGTTDFTYAHTIAETALAAGNKPLALEYFQKAIDIAKSDSDPYDDQSIEGYQATIKYIQSGATHTNSVPAGINIPKEFLQ